MNKNKIYKIGIIGRGFVGSAVENGFKSMDKSELRIYDINPDKSKNSLFDVVNHSDLVFVSIPTPSNDDGSINLDLVDNCLDNINKILKSDPIILLRSTMTPGSSSFFQKKFPKLKIVFNPEFLTEKNANYDFLNQSRIILGGNKNNIDEVEKIYKWRFGKQIPIVKTDYQTAELIKYMNNCFLASKVSFMNEMKLVADKCGADWERAVEGFSLDGRIGNSHLSVPGHDGKKGFGGSCLPKDIRAMIFYGKKLNLNLNTLNGAWKTNLKVRPEKDWEMLIGRSVVRKK